MMFLVKMAVPSLFFAASFVAFIWFLPHLLIATGFFSLLFFLLFQCIFRQGISDKGVNRQEIQDKEIFPQGFPDKEIFRQGLPDKGVNRQEIQDKDLQNGFNIPDTAVMNTLAKA